VSLADRLWNTPSRNFYLAIVVILLLGTALGSKEIWTQETRWANIVLHMLQTGDYLHPFLRGEAYYDKPLLSYWLIVMASWLTDGLTLVSLRLPSVLAGLLAVYCTVQLGRQWFNRSVGLVAGWMLATSFFFIFWSRTASTDMLNIAGMLLAVLWYVKKQNQTSFVNYLVFFIIMSLTSLCKGLLGFVLPLIVIAPHILTHHRWRQHLNFSLLLAAIPALLIYALPFWLSSQSGTEINYQDNGLYLSFRESVVRFFQPYDHIGPIYLYFLYLPIYGLPWTLLLFPALWTLRTDWRNLSENARWLILAIALLFIFFTLSGSRRSYYVLPLIPFAMLFIANWLQTRPKLLQAAAYGVVSFAAIWFVVFAVAMPWYYGGGGLSVFANMVRETAEQQRPWQDWNIVMLDASNKVPVYLHNDSVFEYIAAPQEAVSTPEDLLKNWPILSQHTANTIFVADPSYQPLLDDLFIKDYQQVIAPPTRGKRVLGGKTEGDAVAYIPR